ncbi:MAG TPA: nucleotidyltransferase family protein [Burkholderiaceae bacterium]|nr:nucleotidyltransferase family protein [Burkholderiaceae bacterium]
MPEGSGHSSADVAGILLAAGIGRRYDPSGRAFKLLAPVLPGRNLLQVSAGKLLAATDELLIVHGPRSLQSYPVVAELPARQFSCLQAGQGMGRSLQSAISCSSPRLGWLVALADMPYISRATYESLRQALMLGALLARPVYRGQPGHPVALSVSLRPDLMALRPEEGAGPLFKTYRTRAVQIDVDDAGCVADVDTPEALARFNA